MNRTELACYGLLVSACILAGLLVFRLQDKPVLPTAHASLIANYENVTLMTAQTRGDEEALFALDSFNEKLLIYRIDVGKKRLELANSIELPTLFAGDGRKPGSGSGRRR